MSKLLTVVGATGTQGRSLIDVAIKEGQYKIRGLTRNPSSEKAKELAAKGVEIVQADINEGASLVKAFEGSTAIFATTDFFEPFAAHGPEKAIEIEAAQGINMAKAASQTATLKHYIWSTLPNGERISNGKYAVPHFVAKNRIDDYIKADRELFAKTTFFWITFYGNNYQYPMFTPNLFKTSGAYLQLSPARADTPIYSIGDPSVNVGLFGHAILTQPERTLGKFVWGYVEVTTTGDMLKMWSEVTGKPAHYVQTLSLDEYSDVWPGWGREMGVMMAWWNEAREKSWSGEEGILTGDDLGLKDHAGFVDTKSALAKMDWSKLL